MANILITTIHKGDSINDAIRKFSPDKLMFICPEPPEKTKVEAIKRIKKDFKNLQFDIIKTKTYDIAQIVKDVNKAIKKELKKNNNIKIHISESRKPQSFGAYFAGLLNKGNIDGVYYLKEEDGGVLTMPMLSFKLAKTKTLILNELNKGNKDIPSIVKKSGKQKSIVYQHVKSLKADGYITENLELTDSGKIVVL